MELRTYLGGKPQGVPESEEEGENRFGVSPEMALELLDENTSTNPIENLMRDLRSEFGRMADEYFATCVMELIAEEQIVLTLGTIYGLNKQEPVLLPSIKK